MTSKDLDVIIREAAETHSEVHIEEDGIRIGDYFFWFNRDDVEPEFFKGSWSDAEEGIDGDVVDASTEDILDALKALV